ncbi:MAG TPA: colicin immunity domain-containing protein [Actinomycetes bacterium]
MPSRDRQAGGTPPRLELARRFAAGDLTGDEFETAYLKTSATSTDLESDSEGEVLDTIFLDVDAYLSNDLRQHHGAVLRGDQIDEPELRRRVQVLLDRLDQQDPAG